MIEPEMIEIARLDTREWRVYRELRLAALTDAPTAFGARLADEHDRSEVEWRSRLEHRTQFVARRGGRPLGTVGCLVEEPDVVELVSMWVAPAARGTGVADRLVRAVIEEARIRELDAIILWVSEGNERAERLYARHGFTRTGRTQPVDADDLDRGAEVEMRRVEARPQPKMRASR